MEWNNSMELGDKRRCRGVVSMKEIAIEYYPYVTAKVASRNFRKDIFLYPALITELEKVGLRKNQRKLTPLQLELIYKYLGLP